MTLPAFGSWAGPRDPKLLIVGEAWGEAEYQTHQPFAGASGIELWRMLGEALPDIYPEQHNVSLQEAYKIGHAWIRNRKTWLDLASISYTNVLNLRPPGNRLEAMCCPKSQLPVDYSLPALSRGLYLKPEYLLEVNRLLDEINIAKPNCIIAAGNTACWALLNSINISSIRGTVTLSVVEPYCKVVPIYHPAAILRQWNWRPVTVADIIKAAREAEYPEIIRPERQVLINPTMHDLVSWRDWLLDRPPELLSVDIETHGKQISCIGFAWSPSAAIVVPFLDNSKTPPHYWPTKEDEVSVWLIVRSVLESKIPKLFQNGVYDLQYIFRWGMRPQNIAEDTMLLHHSLYPEMRKGLGFLGSVYSNESAWKLLGRPKADTVKRDE
jgi:Uracil DNA glycosylase superfamily